MLTCRALATPRLYASDGQVQFGAELDKSELGYFLINRAGPDDGKAHHYIEFWDQTFGVFDGLKTGAISSDRRELSLYLNFDVNNLGNAFRVLSDTPLDDDSVAWIELLISEL